MLGGTTGPLLRPSWRKFTCRNLTSCRTLGQRRRGITALRCGFLASEQRNGLPIGRASFFMERRMGNLVSAKPTFLVIGAMKCATTSLCDIFAQHPQMFVCTPKEPDFFCNDKIFARVGLV